MHYALSYRTFLYSHYFYRGLRAGTGVIGLTLLAYAATDLPTAMTVSIGALCTSLMDLPSPLRHKFNEMLACSLLCALITLIISFCAPMRWLLYSAVLVISFLASMTVAYGKKTMPLQFAALFMMTLSIRPGLTAAEAVLRTVWVLCGGLGYLAYSMLVSWFLRHRIKQQILAEALYELARYMMIKADFYAHDTPIDRQFNLLVRQQIVLAEKHQESRDQLLRATTDTVDAKLVQMHLHMIDLYELILSTHTDYALLREQLRDQPVLILLQTLILKAAHDLEETAYDLTRKHASGPGPGYGSEIDAVETALHALEAAASDDPRAVRAVTTLQTSWVKIRAVVCGIAQLRAASATPDTLAHTLLTGMDLTPFLSQQSYELRLLLTHFRWHSPVFRFSLRVTMAIATGLLLARWMPYSAHAYWLILSIVVILKPSFSMTRQRRTDRLLGTIIGCVLTAVILHFFHSPIALIGFLFIATVAAASFMMVKYRFTAIAASMQILLQINLLAPGGGHVISERVLDTFIGAAIATAFSFVLPSWEYRAMPRLIASVLTASQRYLEASGELLAGKVAHDFSYRIARKRFMETLAGLSAALVRMLDEPASQQRAAEEINRFVVQNYLVVAHIAAIRLMLARHGGAVPRAATQEVLAGTWDYVARMLRVAQTSFAEQGSLAQQTKPAVAVATGPSRSAAEVGPPSGARVSHTPSQPIPVDGVHAAAAHETALLDAGVHSGAPPDSQARTEETPVLRVPEITWAAWPRLHRRLLLLRQDTAALSHQSVVLARALNR
ncbi:MAG: FUSC family membrane protein [Burkholderiaceae bacterium]